MKQEIPLAEKILYAKAEKYNDGFTAGQPKWIIEAMEEYAHHWKFHHDVLLEELKKYNDKLKEHMV